ncbi:MAG: double zinc ribbon domain-containing protein [Treponema sp.]|nr:double zinc ribbon domain-containing protein [Treponema sp.]
MKYFYFFLREFFFPKGCGLCGEALFESEDAHFGLCSGCRTLLSSALGLEKRCNVCGKALISETGNCLICRKQEGTYSEHIEKLKCIFPYSGRYIKLLASFKFNKSMGVGNYFICCLINALKSFKEEEIRNAVLVPVPPRPGKLKKQGWDQVEYLAKGLEKSSDFPYGPLPIVRCLKRLPSRSQKELNKNERGANLKGRIICRKMPGDTAILFDDVLTTGATLNACASALIESGCKRVIGICLFYD